MIASDAPVSAESDDSTVVMAFMPTVWRTLLLCPVSEAFQPLLWASVGLVLGLSLLRAVVRKLPILNRVELLLLFEVVCVALVVPLQRLLLATLMCDGAFTTQDDGSLTIDNQIECWSTNHIVMVAGAIPAHLLFSFLVITTSIDLQRQQSLAFKEARYSSIHAQTVLLIVGESNIAV